MPSEKNVQQQKCPRSQNWTDCVDCPNLPCKQFADDPEYMANLLAVYRKLNPSDLKVMLDFLGRARHHLPWICPDGKCAIYDDEPRFWAKIQMLERDPDIGITDYSKLEEISKKSKRGQFIRIFSEVSEWVSKMLVHTLKLWQRHTQRDIMQEKFTQRSVRMIEAGAELDTYGDDVDNIAQNAIRRALGVKKARKLQRKIGDKNGGSKK